MLTITLTFQKNFINLRRSHNKPKQKTRLKLHTIWFLFNCFGTCANRMKFSSKVKVIVIDRECNSFLERPGAPNVNFWKISVRKTIWDLAIFGTFVVKFLACLPLLNLRTADAFPVVASLPPKNLLGFSNMWVYFRNVIDENRFHNCVRESDRESPFKFQSTIGITERITRVETALNNTVNNAHINSMILFAAA